MRPVGESKKILVIAEISAARHRYAAVLRHEGYDVATAASGAEALEQIGKQFFDLVILDLHLGGPAGLNLLYEIRSTYLALREVFLVKDVPVLCLSGSASGESLAPAHLLGAVAILDKPINLNDLLERIRMILSDGQLPAGPSGRTMVVVDPAYQLGGFFQSFFEGLGWHVVQSGNPERMSAVLKVAVPGVMVLYLPVLYDQEEGLLNRFLDLAGRVPLLAIAGSEDQARRARAFFAGKIATLVRPFGLDALPAAVENARRSLMSGSSLPDLRCAS